MSKKELEIIATMVSVPFRGLLFFNMATHRADTYNVFGFPSPFGDYYFSTVKEKRVNGELPAVSVPFRGLLFFN